MAAKFGLAEKEIFIGSVLLMICALFYLAWWINAFRPLKQGDILKDTVLLLAAAAFGIAAVIMTIKGIKASSGTMSLFPQERIVVDGVAVYIVLLLITKHLFKRPVTSELILFVAWAALELSAANALYGSGFIGFHGMAAVVITVICAFAVSLVCYVLYYKLSKGAGYTDGMIPLIAVAAEMAFIAVLIFVKAR